MRTELQLKPDVLQTESQEAKRETAYCVYGEGMCIVILKDITHERHICKKCGRKVLVPLSAPTPKDDICLLGGEREELVGQIERQLRLIKR